MVAGGHVWLLWGACMVFFGGGACMVCPRGRGACMVFARGACMVFSGGHVWFFPGWGMCGFCQGHVWFFLGGVHGFFRGAMRRIRQDTVNERAVRILLECILVCNLYSPTNFSWGGESVAEFSEW